MAAPNPFVRKQTTPNKPGTSGATTSRRIIQLPDDQAHIKLPTRRNIKTADNASRTSPLRPIKAKVTSVVVIPALPLTTTTTKQRRRVVAQPPAPSSTGVQVQQQQHQHPVPNNTPPPRQQQQLLAVEAAIMQQQKRASKRTMPEDPFAGIIITSHRFYKASHKRQRLVFRRKWGQVVAHVKKPGVAILTCAEKRRLVTYCPVPPKD